MRYCDPRGDFIAGLVVGALIMALALQHRNAGRWMKAARSLFTWKEELRLRHDWKPERNR